jgi:hypothetical protein
MALAVLAIVATIMAAVVAQGLMARRMIESRMNQLQSLWLARSGLESAAAHFLAAPSSYAGETTKPIPNSEVIVTVKRAGDDVIVASEARYPLDGSPAVLRRLQRSWRLARSGDRWHLQVTRVDP